MKLYETYLTVLLGGLLGQLPISQAFFLQNRAGKVEIVLKVGGPGGLGWDNDDYLEALSRGPDAVEKANEDYKRASRFDPSKTPPPPPSSLKDDELQTQDTTGAKLDKEMIERIKEQNEKEEAQGGKMFKELMARAQANAQSYMPPPPMMPPPPQPPIPSNVNSLSVEQQAELFRQMMAQQQQPPYRQPPPTTYSPPGVAAPPGYLPGGQGLDGRRIGRNRDADSINNSADLYFAQLKRDSTARNFARYAGDEEQANQVWSDPSIEDLHVRLNPYLQEQQAKEREMVETSEDERLELMNFNELRANRRSDYRGVSYKEKLVEKKKKAGQVATTSQVKVAKSESDPEATSKPSAPATVSATPQVASSGPALETAASSEAVSVADVRTLMGLLLKHRGGPGFGSGRLQGVDVERFEQLAGRVMDGLRKEDVDTKSSSAAPMSGSSITRVTAVHVTEKVDSLIACIDGAILMYRNSPPELREGVMITLRAALLSGANTLNEIVGSDHFPSVPSASHGGDAHSRVNDLISVIEGAIVMYRNSPSDLRQAVLITFRAALLSAIGTLNGIIADNEIANFAAYQGSTAGGQEEKNKPTQFFDVIPEQRSVSESYSGTDDNSVFFEKVYAKLESAQGEGKMGLRMDLDAAEASKLSHEIAQLRARLVKELDSGIPDNGTSAMDDAEGEGSTSKYHEMLSRASKYQEMLAKARAERDAKKDS